MENHPAKNQDSSIAKTGNRNLSYRSVIIDSGEKMSRDDFEEWIGDLQSRINVVRPMDVDQISLAANTIHRIFSEKIRFNDVRLISDLLLTEQIIQIKDRFDVTVLSKAINTYLAKKSSMIPSMTQKKVEKQDTEARAKIAKMAKDLLVKMDSSASDHIRNKPIVRVFINTSSPEEIMSVIDFECDRVEGESDGMYLVKVRKIARKICEESRTKCRESVERLIERGDLLIDGDKMIFKCTHTSDNPVVDRIRSKDQKQLFLCRKSTNPPERIGMNSILRIEDPNDSIEVVVSKVRMIYVMETSIQMENEEGGFDIIDGEELEEISASNGYDSYEKMRDSIKRAPMVVEWRAVL